MERRRELKKLYGSDSYRVWSTLYEENKADAGEVEGQHTKRTQVFFLSLDMHAMQIPLTCSTIRDLYSGTVSTT